MEPPMYSEHYQKTSGCFAAKRHPALDDVTELNLGKIREYQLAYDAHDGYQLRSTDQLYHPAFAERGGNVAESPNQPAHSTSGTFDKLLGKDTGATADLIRATLAHNYWTEESIQEETGTQRRT